MFWCSSARGGQIMLTISKSSLRSRKPALSRGTAFAVAVLASTAWTPVAFANEFPAVTPLSSLDGTNGFRLDGATYDRSGHSVASAGDVNGDGFADLIIGAPDAETYAGSTYVVFGKAAGFAP